MTLYFVCMCVHGGLNVVTGARPLISSLTIHIKTPMLRTAFKCSKCLITAGFDSAGPVFQEPIALSEPMPLEAAV